MEDVKYFADMFDGIKVTPVNKNHDAAPLKLTAEQQTKLDAINNPAPPVDVVPLSAAEQSLLDGLINPDKPKGDEPIVIDEGTGFRIANLICTDPAICKLAHDIGLKPSAFVYVNQQKAVAAAFRFIEAGSLPSTALWLEIEKETKEVFLVPPEIIDRPHIEKLVFTFLENVNVKLAVKEYLDKPDIGKLKTNLAKIKPKQQTNVARRGYSLDELFALPDPEWLIERHINRNDYACIYGPSGDCKTFVGIDWAMSLACGVQTSGEYQTKKGTVAYVISEGQDGFKKRTKSWLHKRGLPTPAENEFQVIPFSFTMCDQNEAEELLEIIRARIGKPDAIFVDTLARNFGGDENAAKDMAAFTKSVDWLRQETGAAVIVVHHTGKNTQLQERGSNALRCAVNSSFEVTKKLDKVTVANRKQKDGKPIDYKLKIVEVPEFDSLVLERTDDVADDEGPTLEARILNLLPSVPPGNDAAKAAMTPTDVSKGVGRDRSDVNKVLVKLAENQEKTHVARSKFGKTGNNIPFKYWKVEI